MSAKKIECILRMTRIYFVIGKEGVVGV